MMRALSIATALLCATGAHTVAAAPKASRATRPTARPSRPRPTPKTQRQAASVPNARARARVIRPKTDSAATETMEALLRAYVGGGTTKFEKRVAKRLKRHKASKAIASRLLARIAPGAKGRSPEKPGGKADPRKAQLAASLRGRDRSDLLYLMPAVPLPPQGVPLPSTYTLQHSGLVATSSEDADGTDELTMLAFIATPEGKGYSVQAVDLGTTSTNTGAAAGGGPVYEGPEKNVVLITALIEDDDGNAEAAADELELLIELAASVASTMQGTDRLALLETMVDYTVALDAVGSTPDRAARSVVTTSLTASEWPGLWSADSTEVSGRHYKVAVPHAMGSGRYEFLLDVPANLPSMHTIRLSLSNFEHTARNTDRAHVGDVEVTASIGGKSHTMHDAPTGLRALERKVLSGDVELSVSAVVHYDIDYPKHVLRQCKPRPGLPAHVVRERCLRAKRGFRAMHDLEEKEPLDLAGTGTTYTTTYSTRLGGFKPAANKKGKAKPSTAPQTSAPIRTRTAKGTDAPWARVTLRATSS